MSNDLIINYGFRDYDGCDHWLECPAESALHAADIIFRLNPELWEVRTNTHPKRDITSKVHHILERYVKPCYKDGREFSPASVKETQA